MKRPARLALLFLTAFLLIVWLNNTSLFSRGSGEPLLIAHRGLAPEMHPEHEDLFICLGRIYTSEHSYIENTIPSIDAAFELGADYVEFDIHLLQKVGLSNFQPFE
jgi:glycerophosphoryl diester phosphodiesterase